MRIKVPLRCATAGLAVVLLVLPLLAGCDWQASGEGEWRTHVSGPGEPFGSGVLVVRGEGILDIVGDAGTVVWTARKGENELRVVAVQEEATGTFRLRIRVRDLSEPQPSVGLIELADLDNEPVPIDDEHRIRYSR
ncbi:MAG: hypothetical protein WD960_06625 [Gemmatimonadota bacterium]